MRMHVSGCATGAGGRNRVLIGAAMVVAIGLAAGRPCAGQTADRVRTTTRQDVQGEVVGVSPNDIEVKDQGSEQLRKVPIEIVREVVFGAEPDSLRSARGLLFRQDAAGALDEIAKIEAGEMDGVPPLVVAERDFVVAAATAGKAIATGGDLPAAEKALKDFVAKNPRSHHLYRAQEMLGDLASRAGNVEAAKAAYGALEKGPPAYRIRGASAKAEMFFRQGKFAESLAEFERSAKTETDPKDEASAKQKREARLGQARCLARTGKAADAIGLVQGVVKEADPEDRETLGRAYTALGDAYRAAGGKDQDALISFLTVDLVYNTVPDAHAEALFNLVDLWNKAKQVERSREAKQSLQQLYPTSSWAKKLAAAPAPAKAS